MSTTPDPMRQRRLDAGRAVAGKVIKAVVAEEIDLSRAMVEPTLAPGERVMAELPDGTVIGSVARSRPTGTAKVTDMPALLAWAKANRPDDVVTVEAVRDATVTAWRKQAEQHGHPFDPDTGEVIPGITVVVGTPAFTPRADEGARQIVMERLAGLVASGDLLALNARLTQDGAA